MSRETVEQKAARYLGEGRLTVTRVELERTLAHGRCVGSDGSVYELGVSPAGWFCSCPAHAKCAHVVALERVAPRPAVPAAADADEWERIDLAADIAAIDEAAAAPAAATGEPLEPEPAADGARRYSQLGPDDPWPEGF